MNFFAKNFFSNFNLKSLLTSLVDKIKTLKYYKPSSLLLMEFYIFQKECIIKVATVLKL